MNDLKYFKFFVTFLMEFHLTASILTMIKKVLFNIYKKKIGKSLGLQFNRSG